MTSSGEGEFDEASENIPAPDAAKVVKDAPSPYEKTRNWLAYILIGSVLVFYLFALTVFFLDLTDTAQEMSTIITGVFGSLQTLIAAVVGFYFGSSKDNAS